MVHVILTGRNAHPLLVELGAKLSPRSARYLDAAAAAPLPPLPAGVA